MGLFKESKDGGRLNRRLAEIERERRRLEREMRSLHKDKGPYTAPSASPPVPGPEARGIEPRIDHRERQAPVRDPSVERLNHYLSSGSFGKCRPLRHERAKQRNRAIFMLVMVALALFVLYRIFFQ